MLTVLTSLFGRRIENSEPVMPQGYTHTLMTKTAIAFQFFVECERRDKINVNTLPLWATVSI